MTGLAVPKGEFEVVRVFALNLPGPEAKAFAKDSGNGSYPLRDALGLDVLKPSGVDLVRIKDLGELGLMGLLTEGHGIAPETLSGDAAKLAALEGHVIVITSSAFGGAEAKISLGPEMSFIGAYPLRAAAAAIDTLASDTSEAPYQAEAAAPAPVVHPGKALVPWWLWAILAAATVLILWLTFGGGA